MKSLERKGNSISPETFKKLKALDKWVYYEILDFINDTDQNQEQMPYEADEITEEMQNDSDTEFSQEDEQQDDETDDDGESNYIEGDTNLGNRIDLELNTLFSTGKTTFSMEELKIDAKAAYNVIFDNYDHDSKNGIETSNFKLVETEEEVFKLTKK